MWKVRYAVLHRPLVYAFGMLSWNIAVFILFGMYLPSMAAPAFLCSFVCSIALLISLFARVARRRIALHESAHAVAAWNRQTQPDVSLMEIDGWAGAVHYETGGQDMEMSHDLLVVLLAGIVSEQRHFGTPCSGGASDLLMAEEAARRLWRTNADRTPEDLLESALADAKRLIADHEHDIVRLADELERCGMLGYDQVKEILGPRPTAD